MIDFLRHLFGLCGEGHGSILTILGIGPFIGMFWGKIKLFYSSFISYLKTLLKHF
jgi:hypothetical protein